MPYPIGVTVAPQLHGRDRMTTAFRWLLAIPQIILVAGPAAFASGLLGGLIGFLSIINWFSIVFTRQSVSGIDEFTLFFLRWHLRASAYAMLLVDPYPPFGDGDYPVVLTVDKPSSAERDPLSVGLRLILIIPQIIVLALITWLWVITAIVAWVAILVSGSYPEGLYQFGVGSLRWTTRANAYALLMVDEYPPFSLD